MSWRLLPDERVVLTSPAWFRLMDDVTGSAPVGRLTDALDLREDGTWRITDVRASIATDGMLTYPGLGRRRVALGAPSRRCRLRIEAEHYRPLYRAAAEGVEFDLHPYDDVTLPTPPVIRADVVLLPGATYPYAADTRVLHGRVLRASGAPVEDALVQATTQVGANAKLERTLTDRRGAFALPLRWVAEGASATVVATNQRTNTSQTVTVAIPGGLGTSQQIVLS